MGTGKRVVPVKEVIGETEEEREAAKLWESYTSAEVLEDQPEPLLIEELVSELLYAGKTYAEIAGYDDFQMLNVVCRKRNNNGALIRKYEDLPPGVHVDDDGMRIVKNRVPYETMYKQVKKYHGLSKEEADREWDRYQATTGIGIGGV